MDILGIIIGRYVLGLIGAIIRYIIHNLFNFKKRKEFNKFWNIKGSDDVVMNNDFANKIVGVAFLFIILFIVAFKMGFFQNFSNV